MAQEKRKTLRDLYPHLSDGELFEAQDRIDRYIRLAVDIFERLRNEPGYPGNMRALTTDMGRLTLDDERSSQINEQGA